MLTKEELEQDVNLQIAAQHRMNMLIAALLNILEPKGIELEMIAEQAQEVFIKHHPGEFEDFKSELSIRKILIELKRTCNLFDIKI